VSILVEEHDCRPETPHPIAEAAVEDHVFEPDGPALPNGLALPIYTDVARLF
jgi:hypothetical protein